MSGARSSCSGELLINHVPKLSFGQVFFRNVPVSDSDTGVFLKRKVSKHLINVIVAMYMPIQRGSRAGSHCTDRGEKWDLVATTSVDSAPFVFLLFVIFYSRIEIWS